MSEVVFYEKPRCLRNARQKALLIRLGHRLEVRDLLRTAWRTKHSRGLPGGPAGARLAQPERAGGA